MSVIREDTKRFSVNLLRKIRIGDIKKHVKTIKTTQKLHLKLKDMLFL